jgi:hypothetical protein
MTTTEIAIVHPIVHLNGTSREELIELRCKTYAAINDAYAVLKRMAPNGRDYYPEPGLMDLAVAQHTRRMQTLDDLLKELVLELDALS